MLDAAHTRLMQSIHHLVCGMDAKELRDLRLRYVDNADGWALIERARAMTSPGCRCAQPGTHTASSDQAAGH